MQKMKIDYVYCPSYEEVLEAIIKAVLNRTMWKSLRFVLPGEGPIVRKTIILERKPDSPKAQH